MWPTDFQKTDVAASQTMGLYAQVQLSYRKRRKRNANNTALLSMPSTLEDIHGGTLLQQIVFQMLVSANLSPLV